MRVCFIQSTFHPFVGGTERQSLQLAQRLRQRGVEVEVVTGRYKGLKPFERVQGIPVHRVWLFDSGSKRSFLQTLSWSVSAFLHLMFSKPFDVYHAHQALTPAFIASIVSKLRGKKSLSKIANTGKSGEMHTLNAGILGKILKPFVLCVGGFIATSTQAKRELLENGVSKIFEIPNGVDTETFKPVKNKLSLRKKLGLPLNKKLVLYLAKVEKQKAFPWLKFLLESWQNVKKKNAELVILGQNRLSGLPNLSSVNFEGLKSNPQDYYQACDVFVLPSSAEGLSNALLEAMSSALPVVATKVSGTVDLVSHEKNGLLVPPNDLHALVTALIRVLSKPSLSLGLQARRTILGRFSFDHVVPKYMRLYRQLCVRDSSYGKE